MLLLPLQQATKGGSPMRADARRRAVILCLTAVSFLGGSGVLRADDGWHALGPVGVTGNEGLGGRVISLAVDPRNPNRVFAGSASGGLWVSELSDPHAAGDANPLAANWRDDSRPYWRWRYVDTGFPVLGVGAIAIHPRDPDVLYVGTGEVYGYRRTSARGFDDQVSRGNYGIGILRSVDGGKTWTKSLDRLPGQETGVQDLAIVPDVADPGRFTVWAATSEGVYRLDTSKGGGGTAEGWKLSLAVVAATSLSVDPQRPPRGGGRLRQFRQPGARPLQDEGRWRHLDPRRARAARELSGQGRAGPLGLQPRHALRQHRQPDAAHVPEQQGRSRRGRERRRRRHHLSGE